MMKLHDIFIARPIQDPSLALNAQRADSFLRSVRDPVALSAFAERKRALDGIFTLAGDRKCSFVQNHYA